MPLSSKLNAKEEGEVNQESTRDEIGGPGCPKEQWRIPIALHQEKRQKEAEYLEGQERCFELGEICPRSASSNAAHGDSQPQGRDATKEPGADAMTSESACQKAEDFRPGEQCDKKFDHTQSLRCEKRKARPVASIMSSAGTTTKKGSGTLDTGRIV
jgi:hypothetical protein